MSALGRKRRIGILGCGNIFGRYAEGLRGLPGIDVVRVADIDPARAKQAATEYDIPAYGDGGDLFADRKVDVVVNLTPPARHAETSIAALEAGKHVYTEKPFATRIADARAMLDASARHGLLLGSAPDTFLGSAVQTARWAVDRGLIGDPIGAVAFVRHSKAETWHPDPRFLFQEGGGPVLDLGPYYIAALVTCLGPVRTVVSASRVGAPTRTVTSPGRVVDEITVEVPTHASAVLTFESGAVGTTLMSFDIWDTDLPRIEIYGTAGTLSLPNANQFDGDVRLKRHTDLDWAVVDPVLGVFGAPGSREQLRRGLGVADLVDALDGRPHRANADLAFHTLDVLTAIESAGSGSGAITLTSTCPRPAPRY